MLKVFKSLVLSSILYGAHLYSRGSQKDWGIREPKYNQTTRKITGEPVVPSILEETGALPLKLYIKPTAIIKAIEWVEVHAEIPTTTSKRIGDRTNRGSNA